MSLPVVIIVLLIVVTIGGSILFAATVQARDFKKRCSNFELPNEQDIVHKDDKCYSGLLDIGTKPNILHFNNWVYTTFRVILTKDFLYIYPDLEQSFLLFYSASRIQSPGIKVSLNELNIVEENFNTESGTMISYKRDGIDHFTFLSPRCEHLHEITDKKVIND